MVPNSRQTRQAVGVRKSTFLHEGAVFVFIGMGIYFGFEFAFPDKYTSASSTIYGYNEHFIH